MNRIEMFLREGNEKGASDIHLAPGSPVMFRIDGELVPASDEKIKPFEIEKMIEPLLTEEQKAELKENGELDFAYSIAGFHRVRFNVFRQRGTYAVALRILSFEIPEAKRLGIVIHTDSPVTQVKNKNNEFIAATSQGEHFESRVLIIAAGSLAGMKEGKLVDPQGFCRTLGLKVQPTVPALTALVQEKDPIGKIWSGVRVQAAVSLISDGKCMSKDKGEVQLTDYGISGIPVFQVSRYASYSLLKRKKTEAVIDFMPSMTRNELLEELRVRAGFTERSAQGQLCGLWNSKLVHALCKKARIAIDRPMRLADCDNLAALAKEYRITITKTNPVSQSQVCAGGVDLREIDPSTMECVNVPGLYLTGEVLDVDGICGGYNLHWAWATGTLAGKAAANKIGKQRKNR